jgi:2,4-dienoyl-CoA reductase-like NADH-dependent reductase (Old Yellow Enzyme family)
MNAATPMLFSPLTIRDVTFRNRIMVSPMNQYSAVDGMATDWHFAHLAQYALGGAGLVCMEATKVERRGLGTVGDMGLWKDEQIEPIRRIASFLKSQGAVPGIQLNHAGRKAGTQRPWEGRGPVDRSVKIEGQEHWPVIAPSAVRYQDGWAMPKEMTPDDIAEVVGAFAQSARRSNDAGMDVLELHGAHGYLIHEFLSPVSNLRRDRYGGSLDNRMRFALEVTEAVRRLWPAGKPLFFRISAQDEGGWSLDDSVVLARELKSLGVDAIDCSSGAINVPTLSVIPENVRLLGYQVPYAEKIRREAEIMTIAVGFIVKAEQAAAIIAEGKADLVAIAREMLYDPFWAVHAARKLGVDPEFRNMPPQYGWWLDRRAKTGYEREL